MTTIAISKTHIAADRLRSYGNMKYDTVCKLHKMTLPREHFIGISGKVVIASAGAIASITRIMEHIKDNIRPSYEYNIQTAICQKNKIILLYSDGDFELIKPPYTLGSGRELAMGAILFGATPEEAVRAAIKGDIGSGGGVSCWELP